ncbi:hypothetical protein [Sulfurospirillum deleyianum]|uniref:Uncharacterized protein n=1 Tax=Sulfurospirillum deleyianum (strain ATCC 51133 / DSM 6946 / 5175) TaxID=525898 RepID=D1B2G0_SULD5|nr:hypothetical protein [Sulfurospirillum deleyianum]ACZ12280.1 hypothetical protein Sdel_1259 [Sulfurospirillum deleyianum DSM 6946]
MNEISKYQIKRFSLSIITSTFLLNIFSSAAFAACVTSDGLTYTCSGTTTNGIQTNSYYYDPVTITLNSGADISDASGTAIEDLSASANLTMESGSKLSGKVLLGDGSDSMTINVKGGVKMGSIKSC